MTIDRLTIKLSRHVLAAQARTSGAAAAAAAAAAASRRGLAITFHNVPAELGQADGGAHGRKKTRNIRAA